MSLTIFQTFHKEFLHNPECQWIRPIGVGGFYGPHYLNDNQGDHIAHLNGGYCELTAQYWVWKNSNEDCVGFYHYRRYLNFVSKPGFHSNTSVSQEEAGNAIAYLTTDEQLASLKKLMSICDVVTPLRTALTPSIDEQYRRIVEAEPWDLFLAEIVKRFPNSIDPEIYFKTVSSTPICNMYVMKRNIFNQYCEDLFSILNAVYEKIGSPYDTYNNRYPGFLGERFLGYWLHIQKHSAVEVPMVVIG